MRKTGSILAAFLASTGSAYAQNDRVQRGPVPDWVVPAELMAVPENASGLVFVRRNDTLVRLDEQGQSNFLSYRVKILHPNALQLGNLAISWNPAGGSATVHVVRVHRDGATIEALDNAQFEILRREDQLEAASLTGILTATMRIPDLRVGDEVEVAMTIRSKDPTLGTSEAGMLLLSPTPAPGRFRLGLNWADGHEPTLRLSPDVASLARRDSRAVTLHFDNPPPATAPNDAPIRHRLQRMIEFSDFPDWAAVSRLFAPLYATAATLSANSPLREEVRRIAAAHASPLDRASAALRLVQQDVRYVYVGVNGGNFLPATADETWQRRYGDCKGKTALLLALLNGLGIEAEAVAVNNQGADDGLDERLPTPGAFDHVLVRARIGGNVYWLDGTLPPVATPSGEPVLPYNWVLPVTAPGSSIENLPWRPARIPEEVSLYEIDARAGFDQPARIVTTTITRGITGLQQHMQFSALTPAQLLTGLRQQMVGTSGGFQTVEDARWRYDARARASVLTITGTRAVDWTDGSFGSKYITLPGGGFNPPERRVRPADQDQNVPYYTQPSFTCHATTVRLPESTQPANWSYNDGFDTRIFGRNYYRAFDLRDGAIRMVRGSRVEQPEIDAATVQRDNARIPSFDNSMAQVTYRPSRSLSPSGRQRVPATYEIDWTGDAVPCLAAAAGG